MLFYLVFKKIKLGQPNYGGGEDDVDVSEKQTATKNFVINFEQRRPTSVIERIDEESEHDESPSVSSAVEELMKRVENQVSRSCMLWQSLQGILVR